MSAHPGLPLHQMDHIHRMPGQVKRPRAERTHHVLAFKAPETWIFEGGHSGTNAGHAARTGLILGHDRPLALCA